MEGRYHLLRQYGGVRMSLRDGDLLGKSNDYSEARPLPIAVKRIPRTSKNKTTGNSSVEGKIVDQSAPVSIPEWSKDFRNKSEKILKKVSGIGNDVDYVFDIDDGDDGDHCELANSGGDSDDDDEGDEDFNCKLPPHEFIARRLARSQISSSVFEGVGRTLKGRDLSKVRNAILTRTGFLESL